MVCPFASEEAFEEASRECDAVVRRLRLEAAPDQPVTRGSLVLVRPFALSQKHAFCAPPNVGYFQRSLPDGGVELSDLESGETFAVSPCSCSIFFAVVGLKEKSRGTQV